MTDKQPRERHGWQILTLLFLAPMTGELLSGSAPPVEFFNPLSLILLISLYGSGALLVRELARRQGKGWASILLLGAAYGIYEEGIVVRSFFDPTWMDLGILAEYGRWLGVNWVWALQLTIYHAVVSIAIPIMLIELLFPAHRDRPWLRKRGVIFYAVMLLATQAFGPLMGMKAPILAYLGSMIVIGLLIGLALRWPVREEPRVKPVRPLKPGWFFLLGFVGMVSIFFPLWILPEQNVPVFYTLWVGIASPALFTALAWIIGGRSWTDYHRLALTAGAMLVWILMAFIAELDAANRPDDPSGMALVGLAFLAFMIWLGIRVRRREKRLSDPLETYAI